MAAPGSGSTTNGPHSFSTMCAAMTRRIAWLPCRPRRKSVASFPTGTVGGREMEDWRDQRGSHAFDDLRPLRGGRRERDAAPGSAEKVFAGMVLLGTPQPSEGFR